MFDEFNYQQICGWIVTMIALALLASACGNTMADGDSATSEQKRRDAKNASFLTGNKVDAAALSPDTAEADGVLKLVNEASYTKLDETVGLDQRAAYHIASYRMGDDDTPGTADDRTFDSLEELDGVYWVGTHAVSQLLEYAERNGYVAGAHTMIHGVPTGTDDAQGVLRLANDASKDVLDTDVGLDIRAAKHIVAYRNDNGFFDQLAELDRVKWVGERAFGKLLDYAENNHYVPADSWRGIFDRGEVDVTIRPVDGSCERRRCVYTRNGSSGSWQCERSEIDDFTSVTDIADLRITGQNPGELTITYTAEDASGAAWSNHIEGDGQFSLGGENEATAQGVTKKREFDGSLYRDYVHSAEYSRVHKTDDERRYLDCSLTLERKTE